jgi:hypothetical protein
MIHKWFSIFPDNDKLAVPHLYDAITKLERPNCVELRLAAAAS